MKALPKQDACEFPTDLSTICAADVMQRNLITVRASDAVSEVERVLAEAKISGVPVLNDNDEIIGVLSTADLVNRYAEGEDLPEDADYRDLEEESDPTEVVAYRRSDAEELCAGDLMTPDISFVAPGATLREVARMMVAQQVHRLLVVERGRVVGLISTLDVLRAIAE